MSVDHRASIIYGIKISAEERSKLPESFLREYEDDIYPINAYDDNTEYIIGIILHSVAEGYYSAISPINMDMFRINCPEYIEAMFWEIEMNPALIHAIPRSTERKFYLVGAIS